MAVSGFLFIHYGWDRDNKLIGILSILAVYGVGIAATALPEAKNNIIGQAAIMVCFFSGIALSFLYWRHIHFFISKPRLCGAF